MFGTPMPDESKSPVFVREATGLVKNVSLLDAISINLSYMSIGAALSLVGFTTILLPTVSGVNLVYGSLIAEILTTMGWSTEDSTLGPFQWGFRITST